MSDRGSGPALVAIVLCFTALVLATAWSEPWGLFHDELYYWACSRRPGFGYVDFPPLSAWLLAITQPLLGDGPLGFRLVPALCGATTVLLTATMARALGARTFGQAVAALAIATAPFHLVFAGFYSTNAIEILLWTLVCALVVRVIHTGNARWLAVGLVAGVALLNKHTVGLLLVGIAVGVVASPQRRDLRRAGLWAGVAVAALLAAPNVWWNALHGWPSLAFYQSRPSVDLSATVGQALVLQIVGMNPAAVLLWVPGVLGLLFSRRLRAYRPLAVAFLVLLAMVLLSNQRRGDRIAGIYPVVIAAGGVLWDQWRGRGATAARAVLPVLLVVFGLLLLPVSLPVLTPDGTRRYFEAIDERPEIEAGDVGQLLPVHLNGRLDWERFVDDVVRAVETLPVETRARSVLLAPHWLYASVLEYYGRGRGLPPVVSPHNAYYFWRDDARGRDVAVSVAIERVVLDRYFAETRRLGVFRCVHCVHWRPDMPIHLSQTPRRPLIDLLGEWRHFGIDAAPALRPGSQRGRSPSIARATAAARLSPTGFGKTMQRCTPAS